MQKKQSSTRLICLHYIFTSIQKTTPTMIADIAADLKELEDDLHQATLYQLEDRLLRVEVL